MWISRSRYGLVGRRAGGSDGSHRARPNHVVGRQTRTSLVARRDASSLVGQSSVVHPNLWGRNFTHQQRALPATLATTARLFSSVSSDASRVKAEPKEPLEAKPGRRFTPRVDTKLDRELAEMRQAKSFSSAVQLFLDTYESRRDEWTYYQYRTLMRIASECEEDPWGSVERVCEALCEHTKFDPHKDRACADLMVVARARSGQWPETFELFKQRFDVKNEQARAGDRSVVYLLATFVRLFDVKQAVELLDVVVEARGETPNVRMADSLVKSLVRFGQVDAAATLALKIAELNAAKNSKQTDDFLARKWSYTMSSVIQALCDAGKLDTAIDVVNACFDQLHVFIGQGPLSTVMRHLCRASRADDAQRLFDHVISRAPPMSSKRHRWWLENAAKFGSAREFLLALNFAATSGEPLINVNFNERLHTLGFKSTMHEMLELFDFIVEHFTFKPDEITYGTLFSNASHKHASDGIVHELIEHMERDNVQPNQIIYSHIICAFAMTFNGVDGLKWVDRFIADDALMERISGDTKARRDLERLYFSIFILFTRVRFDDSHRPLSVYEHSVKHGVRLDGKTFDAFIRSLDPEIAAEFVEKLSEDVLTPQIIDSTIQHASQRGTPEVVKKVGEQLLRSTFPVSRDMALAIRRAFVNKNDFVTFVEELRPGVDVLALLTNTTDT